MIFCFFMVGCSPKPFIPTKEMTTAVNRWFQNFWIPSDYYSFIKGIPEIHLCGCEEVLIEKYNERNNENLTKIGYAGLSNPTQIWLVVHKTKSGKIIINQYALGHELQHWLNFRNKIISNPDEALMMDYYK